MTITSRRLRLASVAGAAALTAACGSSNVSQRTATAVTPAAAATTAATAASPPAPPPGGSTTSSNYTATGRYTRASGTAVLSGRRITATGSDQSGLLVTGGTVTVRRSRVTTTGSSKSSDASSFYGLDAGVLASGRGRVNLAAGTVTTSGAGANAVFAYGSSAAVTVRGTRLTAHGQYAHGAMASGGGRLTLDHVMIHTAGGSSAAVATDRGGGTVTVSGGTMITTGATSPGIYSTGTIAVSDATMLAQGSEAAVVEGANSIAVTNSSLTGTVKRGVMLYQSMSGDAAAGTGSYTMVGGSLNAKAGPAFYVTNEKAVINVSGGARIKAASGVLLRSDSTGTGSGNTGPGVTTFQASSERLSGDLVAAGSGSISAILSHTTLKGAITAAALTLQTGSVWTVSGNSTLTTLTGATMSRGRITNIVGNGHLVTYDSALAGNRVLGAKTYTLAGGGTLKPA
ncbi:MAG: hypothetical protein ABSG43_28970 [Solirubrobacteraceae bacterium]